MNKKRRANKIAGPGDPLRLKTIETSNQATEAQLEHLIVQEVKLRQKNSLLLLIEMTFKRKYHLGSAPYPEQRADFC